MENVSEILPVNINCIIKYPIKKHALVCHEHREKAENQQILEEYKQRDPIEQVRQVILKKKYASEDDLNTIDSEIKEEVVACVKFAEESNFPDPSEAMRDVYAQEDYPYIVD